LSHHREVVTATGVPATAGPYSHAVRTGGLLFCSGQVGRDPDSGALAEGGPPAQVRQCLDNLETVCAAAGAGLRDAVRMTVYVTDMGAFAEVNEAYGAYFPSDPPARVTIGVAALPGGAEVEVDAVVALPH